MTQRDKWAKRPATEKYWAFKEECEIHHVELPEAGASIEFIIPMPKSWSRKKRAQKDGTAHQSRPDLSNMLKALEDAVHPEDSHIWHYNRLFKVWGEQGAIVIT